MQQKVAEARTRRLQAAIDDWRKELIDLSGRNPLLSFRDLKRGTLSLDTAEPSARQRLLQDQPVMLTELFDAEHIRDAVLTARTIQNKARENYEERGLATLFLALGMATWHASEGQATPRAPVLLRQARLSQQRGSDDDLQLQLDGDWQFNPVLQHVIETQYGAKLPIEELVERLSRSNEYESILRDFAARAADAVAQFDITTRVVLGNFSYTKLPLVQDLEGAGELLAQHPLISSNVDGLEDILANARPPTLEAQTVHDLLQQLFLSAQQRVGLDPAYEFDQLIGGVLSNGASATGYRLRSLSRGVAHRLFWSSCWVISDGPRGALLRRRGCVAPSVSAPDRSVPSFKGEGGLCLSVTKP